MIPLLPGKPLFIPDLPGYGASAPTEKHDKITVGLRVIEALEEVVSNGKQSTTGYPPIVLVGHDRGARVAHQLHLSAGKADIRGFKIIGLGLVDIIPTLYQWENTDSAAAQKGGFHWAFLANVHISKPMIMAWGGGNWAQAMIDRWAGANKEGLEKMRSGDSTKVYRSFFDQESVVEASCLDYEAGATVDVDYQKRAIQSKQGVTVPLLTIYSQGYLQKRAKKPVGDVWGSPEYCADPSLVTARPIDDGFGHFLPEEAPELTAKYLLDWLKALNIQAR